MQDIAPDSNLNRQRSLSSDCVEVDFAESPQADSFESPVPGYEILFGNNLETHETDPRIHYFMKKVFEDMELKYGGSIFKHNPTREEEKAGSSKDSFEKFHPLFHGLGQHCRRIYEGRASYDALAVIYKFPSSEDFKVPDIDLELLPGIFKKVVDRGEDLSELEKLQLQKMWIMEMENAKGVRNRFKMLRKNIAENIIRLHNLNNKATVKICSIACGSAMAVSEAVAFCKKDLGIDVEIMLLDFNSNAVSSAVEYAKSMNVQIGKAFGGYKDGNIFTQKSKERISEFKPDIVEVAGLIDYLSDEQTVGLMNFSSNVCSQSGYVVTCNILPNQEQEWLHGIIGWQPMIYRTPKELFDIGSASNSSKSVNVDIESQNVHAIMTIKSKG